MRPLRTESAARRIREPLRLAAVERDLVELLLVAASAVKCDPFVVGRPRRIGVAVAARELPYLAARDVSNPDIAEVRVLRAIELRDDERDARTVMRDLIRRDKRYFEEIFRHHVARRRRCGGGQRSGA